jgi:hypothetical protein
VTEPVAEDIGQFAYRIVKDRTVFVSWQGRVITTLRGAAASRFEAQAEGAGEAALQLLLARATGNFKRGNER